MTSHMRDFVKCSFGESLELLRQMVSEVQVASLKLAPHIVNADDLREVIRKCEGLRESPVIDQASRIIAALEALPWTRDADGMNKIRNAIMQEIGGQFIDLSLIHI